MMDPATDEDVLTMISLREGDDMALNHLMNKWQKPLISFLYRMTNNYQDAVDLAQETFVRVYRNRLSYKPSGSFSTWLFTIATRLARNRARWRRRHPETPIDIRLPDNSSESFAGPLDRIASSEVIPSERMVRDERNQKIQRIVQRLPVELRESLVLYEYQDMSYADIAESLRCSTKAVETRIYRARKLLKSWLHNVSDE